MSMNMLLYRSAMFWGTGDLYEPFSRAAIAPDQVGIGAGVRGAGATSFTNYLAAARVRAWSQANGARCMYGAARQAL